MATTISVQVTSRQILIPRAAIRHWDEVEVTQTEQHIVLSPKTLSPAGERELAIQALREDGLLYEPEGESDVPVVSDEERAELAKRLGVGRPLSEMVIEERSARLFEPVPDRHRDGFCHRYGL
jgi:hypothetical protein